MRLTTLCYAENNGRWLMMHRVKKAQDENAGKWIGIGGHLEEGETPEACIRREALEETGLSLTNLKLRGVITFILPKWGDELTCLYTASSETDVVKDSEEGILRWIPKDEVLNLPLWPGDRIFLPLLQNQEEVFSLKLIYDAEDRLVGHELGSLE